MAMLTLTKGMDQVANIELTDEAGLTEILVGSLTASDFRIVVTPLIATNVLKISGTPGAATILNGVVSVPITAVNLNSVPAGRYFGQWSGVVNAVPLTSEIFDVVVEPKVGA